MIEQERCLEDGQLNKLLQQRIADNEYGSGNQN